MPLAVESMFICSAFAVLPVFRVDIPRDPLSGFENS